MRIDALSMMLSMANVGAGARVLVFDGTGGLVTAACLERLGGCALLAAAEYLGLGREREESRSTGSPTENLT